jgi:N utilization substance protein A
MVEYADDPNEFLANIFRPVEIHAIGKDPGTGAFLVTIKKKSELGTAIGKKGANIEKARLLMRKFWGAEVGEIRISDETL